MSHRNNYSFGLPISTHSTTFASLPFEAEHLRHVFAMYLSNTTHPTLDNVCRTYHRALSRKTLLATQQHLNLTLGQSLSNPVNELLALTITLPNTNYNSLEEWALTSEDTINHWLNTSSKSTNPGFQGSRFSAIIIHETTHTPQLTLLLSRIAFFNDHRARLDHTLKTLPSSCNTSPLIQDLTDFDFMHNATIHLHSINLD